MFYFEKEENQLQAGLALRIGKLLKQYQTTQLQLDKKEQYDATLVICCLQTLLTNCKELLDATHHKNKKTFLKNVVDVPLNYGLSDSFVVENTFLQDFTYYQFIKRLRNALSHPAVSNKGLPSTGYEALKTV